MTAETAENRRKKLIQMIHIGKARMGLTDGAYQAFPEGVCGKQSCADMSVRQLETALRVMRKNGFERKPRRVKPEEQGMANASQLEYIKGMRAVCARNKSGQALGKMIKRTAGADNIRFLNISGAQKVIPALRDMMEKAGFDPDTPELKVRPEARGG